MYFEAASCLLQGVYMWKINIAIFFNTLALKKRKKEKN